MNENNNPWRPAIIAGCALAVLLAMFYVPRIKLGDTWLRRINILSDIQRVDSAGNVLAEIRADRLQGLTAATDSLEITVVDPAFRDSIPPGMVAIEDFSDTGAPIMERFYAALDSAKQRPVRIAYFSDSFTEGDVLTQDLRELLQQKYGGCGVGFVDINCLTVGYRKTIRSSCANWSEHAPTFCENGFDGQLQGINGRYFLPLDYATFEANCRDEFPGRTDHAERATVFFTPGHYGTKITAGINSDASTTLFEGGDSGQPAVISRSIAGNITRFRMTAYGSDSRFYGVAFDCDKGVIIDNFAIRSATGDHLRKISDDVLMAFGKERPYDLIVWHYGINVANPSMGHYPEYKKNVSDIIARMKRAYPDAAILICGMSDRDTRDAHGNLSTRPGIKEFLQLERQIAAEQHIAYWSLYDAMGGNGSMVKLTEAGEAEKDYCHVNFLGGKRLANLIFKVWENGKQNYDRKYITKKTGRE